MAAVSRLVTYTDVSSSPWATGVDIDARLEAELDDGTSVVLLDDRGWSSSGSWSDVTMAEAEGTARMVVGPDEPPEGRTYEEEANAHWEFLAGILARGGTTISGAELRRARHDVVVGARLRAAIAPGPR